MKYQWFAVIEQSGLLFIEWADSRSELWDSVGEWNATIVDPARTVVAMADTTRERHSTFLKVPVGHSAGGRYWRPSDGA